MRKSNPEMIRKKFMRNIYELDKKQSIFLVIILYNYPLIFWGGFVIVCKVADRYVFTDKEIMNKK